MDQKTYIHIVYTITHEVGGQDVVRSGMKRLGYPSQDYLFPIAKIMEVAEGTDDERASLAADMELIRDYYCGVKQ